MRGIGKWLYDNSLSIVFCLLFLGSLALQGISGHHAENVRRAERQKEPVQFSEFIGSGTFLDGMFVNWQAAILQLGALIVFTTVLRQKGASHSRDPDKEEAQKQRQEDRRWPWLYRNSLSIAFVALFLGSLVAHIFFGTWAYNETRALTDDPPISVSHFLRTGQFWFTTTQTWETEFVAIVFFLVLTIYLRQEGSPESKPVGSSNQETGETIK